MTEYVKQKTWKNFILILAAIFGAGVHIWWQGSPATVFAQSLDQISVSLSLFDVKNEPVNGKYEVRFGIYTRDRAEADAYPSNADTGARLWTETKEVEVRNGMIRVFLGDTEPLPAEIFSNPSEYYLGVRIGDDSEMVPRKKITSVPSAFNSRFLNGKTIGTKQGDIATLGKGGKIDIKVLPTGTGTKQLVLGNDGRLHDQNTDTGTDATEFNIGAGSGIGAENFSLSVSNADAKPALRYNGSTNEWELSNDGTNFNQIGSGTQIVTLGTDTVGDYVAGITAGDGITGSASGEGSLPTFAIDLLSAADGIGAISSRSGLEFAGGSSDQLSLLQGCANGQGLAWNDATNVWECNSFAAGLSGTGTAGYATYWSGASSLGSEQYLDPARGGTGLDGSAAGNGTLLIGDGTGYTLGTIGVGNGLAVTNGAGTIAIALDVDTAGTTVTAVSNSGLEVTSQGLRLIGGCANDQVLAWDSGNVRWVCSNKSGGTSDWTSTGTLTHLTDTSDDFAIGGSSLINAMFSIDVSSGVFSFAPNNAVDPSFVFEATDGDTATLGFNTGDALYVSGGNFGIGDTSPLSLLSVGSGDAFQVNASGAVVSGTWNGSTLTVPYGGTGRTTLTSNGVLYGNAAGAVGMTAEGADAALLLSVSSTPSFVAMSGDLSITNTGLTTIQADAVSSAEILNSSIAEVDLNATNGPTAGYVLSYDAGGGFTWITASGLGTNYFTQTASYTYLTDTAQDFVLGSSTTDAGFFFDVSASTLAFEGATANGFETTLGVVEPTADRNVNLPNVSGTVITTGNLTDITATGIITSGTWNGTTIGVGSGGTGVTTFGGTNTLLYTTGANTLASAAAGTSGQTLIANGSGVPTFVSLGGDIASVDPAGIVSIAANAVALGTDTTGNYVATVASGNGINSSVTTGEGAATTLSLSALTSDWNQSGAFNIVLGNSSAGLKVLENGATPSLYGIFDVTDLSTGDKTYTFPDLSGTVALITNKLSVFAPTTSAELGGVLSDETGSGSVVYSASPVFTGDPTAPTAASGDNDTSVATTAFVKNQSYLTAETDTLALVTGRGATTSTASSFTGGATIRSLTVDTATGTDDRIVVSIASGGAARFDGTITNQDLTANRTWTFPNVTGTVITNGDTGSVNGTIIADGTIEEIDLEATNSPTNAYLLSYDNTSGGFTWVNPASAGTGTITTVGDVTAGAAFDGTQGTQLYFNDADGDGLLTIANLTAARTYTLPDADGTIYTTGNDPYDTVAEIQGVSVGGDLTGTIGSASIAANAVALGTDTTGNYVATVASGNGINSSVTTGEGAATTLSLSALTSDWNQSGAFNIVLGNSSAGLKVLENGATPSLYGIFDVTDLSTGDKTYTFPDLSGTVALITNKLSVFAPTTSAELGGVLSDETGSGSVVYSASPVFTGDPTAPTAASGDNDTSIATTAFVKNQSYLTAEADTLALVTGRGATTSTASSFTGGATIRSLTVDTATGTDDRIVVSIASGGAARFDGTITNQDLTANRTWTFPNVTGTVITNGDTGSVNGTIIADGTIEEIDLEATNAPTNAYLLSYDNTTGGFTWVNPASAGTGTITTVGDVTAGAAFDGTQGTQLLFNDADGDGLLTIANLTAARTYTLPDASGTVVTTGNLSSITAVGTITSGAWQSGTDIGVAYGGTGVSTFGGTNTILYTTATDTIASITTANSGVLVTNGSGAPSIATDIPTAVTIGGAYVYRAGGTDITLADGGTGASLTDPGADRFLFWDDSNSTIDWLSYASNLSITGTTLDLAASIQLGSNGTDGTLTIFSEQGGTDYTTVIQPGTQTENITYTLPANNGDASQLLSTDGNGNLTWLSVSGAGALDGVGSTGAVAYWTDSNTLTYENQLALSRGGTGASLTDPGADRFLFWDDSNSTIDWLSYASNLSITGTTLDLAASIQLGSNGTDGTLTIFSEQGGTDYTTVIQPGTQTENITYTLPANNGDASQLLSTDGNGNLTWLSVSGAGALDGVGSTGAVAYWTDSNTLTYENQLALSRGGTGASLTDPGADRFLFWDDSNSTIDWLSYASNLSITGTTLDLAASIQLGSNGTDGTLTIFSEQGGTDYTTVIQPGTQTENITYTLPANNGDANHVLITDGSGNLSWASATGGAGAGDITTVGDVTAGAAFDGTQGTQLLFNDADGDGLLTIANLTAARTYTLPDASGTIYTSGNDPYDTAAEIQNVSVGGDLTGTIGSASIAANSVALGTDTTGNYVATVASGNGINSSVTTGEGAATTLSLSALTSDWIQSGAFNIVLGNSSAGLKVLENGATPSLYGIFDVTDLSTGDKTYTFPDLSGTVALITNKLSVFAPTTSAELGGVLSDETGSGSVVYSASPVFTGDPTAPTAANGDNDTSVATTAFVKNQSYLTAETDTLALVTGRGATTSTASSFTGGATIRSLTVDTATGTDDRIVVSIASGGAARFDGTITNQDLTANRTWTFPNVTGTVITNGDTGSVNGTIIADGTIEEIDLEATNSPTNAYLLSYDNTSGGFTWVNPASAGTGTITTVGDVTAGAAFDGTQGTQLYFNDADGDGLLTIANLTAARTYTLPDADGTIYTTGNDPYDTVAEIQGVSVGGDLTGTIGSASIAANAVALGTDTTGNYVATVASGNGINSSVTTGEGAATTLSLSALTSDWNQSGAFNIVLGNSSAGLKVLENGATPTLYGIFDVTDLSTGDKTYTFPDLSGTVALTANKLSVFASTTSAELAGVLSDETGSGFVVYSASPVFTGDPTAPTAANGDNDTSVATTAFVKNQSYLTAETDTLALVTGRGATTSTASSFTGGATIRSLTVDTATGTDDRIVVSIASGGAARFDGTITNQDLTANRTWTFPNVTGTVITNGDTGSVMGTMIADGTIEAVDFESTNAPGAGVDNYVLSYDDASGGFTWVSTGGLGTNYFTDGGSVTYLTDTADDFAIGGSSADAFGFFFDVSAGSIQVEGTPDAYETTLQFADTTGSDKTITVPNVTGTIITTGNLSSITAVGTITSGTWNGGTIAVGSGGTGATTLTSNGVLYGSGAGAIQATTPGTDAQVLVANGSEVPTFVSLGSDVTINNAGAVTIQPNAVVLTTDTTGNYVASIGNGSGIAGGNGGSEGAALTLSLGDLTSDWNQTGASDIVLGNAGSELRIMESTGATYYGTFDVADLTANRTYTFPDAGGSIPIGSGTSNYAVYWSGTNTLGSEQYLSTTRGGTGVGSFGGTNTILYTTAASTLASIATANSGVLVTNGSGVPSIGTDLPIVTIGGAYVYRAGGTDVTLADGGTGYSLADPNADRLLFWDDDQGHVDWLSYASNLAITGTTLDLSAAIQLGSNGTDGTLTLFSEQGTTDYTTLFQPGTQTQSITYTLPANDGDPNHVLITDGSGNLSWASATGGAGAGDITDIGDVSSGAAFTSSGTQGTSLWFYDADGRGQVTIANLTAARTYTLPDASGTVITVGNLTDITGLTDAQISDTLTASIFVGSGSTTNAVDLATAEISGTLGVGNGGTGATSLNNLIALGTHTTGNYVQSVATTTLTGLQGGAAGSEGGILSLAFDYTTALSGDPALSASNIIFGTNGLIFEGATADTNESFLTVADPGADATYTLSGLTGTIWTSGNDGSGSTLDADTLDGHDTGYFQTALGYTAANAALSNLAAVAINTSLVSDTDNTDDLGSAAISWKDVYARALKIDGSTSGTVTIQASAVAGTPTITLPSTTGTLIGSGDTGSVTGTMIASDTIQEVDLDLVSHGGAGEDGYLLSYSNATGGFSWVSPGTAGVNYFTDGGPTTYLTSTTDDLGLGGSSADAFGFFFDVSAGSIQVEGTPDAYETTLQFADTTGSDKTITVPNLSGMIALLDGGQTFTSATWNGTAIGVAYGGTNITSYTVGDILYASGATTLSKLADVATGSILISGGVATAPSWGEAILGTHTSGNYVAGLTQGTGITVTGSAGEGWSPTVAIDLLDTIDGTSGITSSNSGLEFQGTGSNELTLLQGCANDQVLSWNESSSIWQCSDKTGGTSDWTDGGTFTYLTATTDDLGLGGSSADAFGFFFDVSAGSIQVEGTPDAYETTLQFADTTGSDKTITVPNLSGMIALLDGGQTFTSATWNGAAIGAQYGGTGINTSASTGVAVVDTGTWSIASTLSLAKGGTNKNLTAVNGGIAYTDADSFEVSAAGTVGQALVSGGAGAPTWFAPTLGSVVFAGASGALTSDNANFFWDDSTNRLGLGTATPQQSLHIYGAGNKLRLGYDGSNYVDLSSTSTGDLSITGSAATQAAFRIGDGVTAQDLSVQFDGASQDYYAGLDDTTGYYMIGSGFTVGTTPYLSITSAGNIGIGTSGAPASLLSVGGTTGNFQVSSAGAIAAATGITSSGTITLSGIANDGAEATALLINGSNQVVSRELGTNAFTSGGFANTALSNLASVAINTALLPGTDDSIDLGDNTHRFRDLYLGGETVHIGTSTTDEATIGYDTIGNILNIGTDSTTNGDIAFFTDDLYLDKSAGYVGIGDTTPDSVLDILSSAAAHTALTIGNTNAGVYNPLINFELAEGTTLFSLGIDDSDSDTFKIFAGSDISGTNQFTMDSTGTVSIANLNLGSQNFDTDAGVVSWVDMPVTSASALNLPMSYSGLIDGNTIFTVYAESDGAGGIINSRFDLTKTSIATTATTEYGLLNTVTDTGIVTTGTDTTYGDSLSVTRTGATGGTINSYGQYTLLTTDNAGAGTSTAYGSYIDTGVAGATNADTVYGQYITTESNAGTAYALYADAGTGAGTEYSGIFMNGNVGIGTATPTSLLSVGATSQFQVNSTGAIAAATGITSSGTITFSGLNTNGGLIWANGSGVLAQTAAGTAGQALISGGAGSPTYYAPTLGSVIFAGASGALTADNANFFWDDSTNRLGLGTVTPSAMLDVYGAGNKIRLSYDGSNYVDLSSTATGELNIALTGTGDSALVVGDGTAEDVSVQYDGATQDYFAGLDNTTGAYMIGSGFTVQAANAYLTVTSTGNVGIGDTTPDALLDLDATQTSGTLIGTAAPSAVTLAGALTGLNLDLSTNYTATGYSVTGSTITLPAVTNTGASTYDYQGLTVTGGALVQNTGAGVDTWNGVAITNPNITATTGTLISNGLKVATGSITTNGTQNGVNIAASGVGAGSLNGVNIGAITAGAGTENAITIGANWDNILNSATLDISGAGAITGATGITSSGTITFSGLSTAGIVTNTSGGVLGTTATVPVANGGTGITTAGLTGVPYITAGTWSVDTNYLSLAHGGTNAGLTASNGGIAYTDADSFEVSAAGTVGQALVSGGAGAPTWFAPTIGSVVFAGASGALTSDTANFFWDDSTNRLGLGTATPSAMLDVYGAGNKIRLSYDGSNYTELASSATGALDITTSATGESALVLGDTGSAQDTSVKLRNSASNYYVGLDDATGDFMIGTGTTVGNNALFDMTSSGGITLTGTALTTTNFLTLNANTLTTAYAETINVNGTTVLTTGGAIDINGPTGAATMNATTGLVNISSTGAVTNSTAGAASGTLLQITGNGSITPTLVSVSDTSVMTTTGKLLDLTANAATTTTGLLTMNATGLTTGYAQNINVNGAAVLTSGGAVNIVGPTGTAAQAAGSLLKIATTGAVTGTDGSGNSLQVSSGTLTGTVASITGTGVMTTTGDLLTLTANSATTATGLLTITANGLTSGSAVNVASSSAALTGSLQKIALSGSNAANTGNLLLLADTGAANATTPLKVTAAGAATQVVVLFENTGSGTSFRVNDASSDTTPFLIDASGNVGIGTATPAAMLDVYGTTNKIRLSYDGSNYVDLSATSTGDLSVTSSSSSEAQAIVGSDTAVDTSVAFDNSANDYYAGVDHTTGSFMIGTGFVPGTTQMLEIATTGDFGIGTGATTPTYRLSVQDDASATYVAQFGNDGNNADRYGIQIQAGADDASGTTYYLNALDGDGGQVGYIANTSGTFALTDVSDISTKTNITDTVIGSASGVISDLRVVDFNRLADPEGPRITGFIAQEVAPIYPAAVTTGPTGLLGIMKEAFIPLLVKAVQEQQIVIAGQGTDITALDLKTDASITTLGALQASVDTQLTVIGDALSVLGAESETTQASLTTLDTRVFATETATAAIQEQVSAADAKVAELETQMTTLSEQNDALVEFFNTFELGDTIAKDAEGNVDLLGGTLKARILETGGIVVENVSEEAPTIGSTEILPVAADLDADGNDDWSGAPMTDEAVLARDGKTVRVMTNAMIPMVKGSRIFTSFRDNPGSFSWIEKYVDEDGEYVGFDIRLESPVTDKTTIDWWLIEQK